jgi:transcriptional regulator with XRE-family HTH domain
MGYTFRMRRSPLLHPLAVLRITAGLTQKAMGDFVNRAARTIQSIELRKMPLTAELALRIAEATGVDEAWLFAGDPNTPPRKGLILIQAGRGEGEYTKDDYEFYRAYVETGTWTYDEWKATREKAKAKGKLAEAEELPARKLLVVEKQVEFIKLIDDDLKNELRLILSKTEFSDDMRLVRWKIRRFMEDLAKEFSLEIPKTGISVKSLAHANPPSQPKVSKPDSRQGRRNQG